MVDFYVNVPRFFATQIRFRNWIRRNETDPSVSRSLRNTDMNITIIIEYELTIPSELIGKINLILDGIDEVYVGRNCTCIGLAKF